MELGRVLGFNTRHKPLFFLVQCTQFWLHPQDENKNALILQECSKQIQNIVAELYIIDIFSDFTQSEAELNILV